ncbi:MAG: hypothetical protein JSR45_17715 [Proteobacteria bacterium]|nr:hypothetical protein [Pseudomonadota bacterium]
MEWFGHLVALTPAEFAAVVALFLPGFISLKVDRLIHPSARPGSAEMLIDVLGYSLVNAGVFSWAILLASKQFVSKEPDYRLLAGLALVICVIGPCVWPVLGRVAQQYGAKLGLLRGAHAFAFDQFFSRREPCWLIVHLKEGRLVGGYFGENSYATVEPHSGDLYIEELWRLDPEGEFLEPIAGSKGALFRADDYHWVEVFWDGPSELAADE